MPHWNRIQEIDRLNKRELELNISESASWHRTYSSSAYIFAGGLHYDLTEGDLITVFSQFGEIVDCNLIRDEQSGDSKGFAFIAFENQKSTDLAVDNMNGALLLQRTLNVDHVKRYRKPKQSKDKEKGIKDNKYGDIDEDDETYEARRKKIWDYQKYLGIDTAVIDAQNETTSTTNSSSNRHRIDGNEVAKVNKQYFKERRKKEDTYDASKKALDKQIEIRKLKRRLMRMKRNEKHKKNDHKKGKKRKDYQKDEWIENGNELRDRSGRLIDIEKELERRKRLEEMEKKEQYAKEMQEIKAARKRKKLAKKSKSQILNSKLKKLNKKRKKANKHNKFGSRNNDNAPPFKKRKVRS
eukprot:670029_1